METCLFLLFILSLVYCCDYPAWNGFEFLVNDHNSLLYSIGVSIIASYIFYLIQVFIPRTIRYNRTRNIAHDKLYHIEIAMHKTLCYLQGETPYKDVTFSKEAITKHLTEINIFLINSKYEIHQHKELSVFEALFYYDNQIISLVDEIIAGQYLPIRYEKHLLNLKKSSLHKTIISWNNKQPGEYERRNQTNPGYFYVNPSIVNSEIISSIDEYLKMYRDIQNKRNKIYNRLHSPWNEIINSFLHR